MTKDTRQKTKGKSKRGNRGEITNTMTCYAGGKAAELLLKGASGSHFAGGLPGKGSITWYKIQ